jgi:hypothetical protein
LTISPGAALLFSREPVMKSKRLPTAVFNVDLALLLVRFAAVNGLPPICGPQGKFAP